MAVAFDAQTEAHTDGGAYPSFTHTPVGTPTAILVTIHQYLRGGINCDITSVTYNGVALTMEARASFGTSEGDPRSEVWSLPNPASGAQTVATNVGTSTTSYFQVYATTFTGSDTTTACTSANGATGTSTTPSVTISSQSGDLVIDAMTQASAGATITVGAGQTQKYNVSAILGTMRDCGSTEGGASSVVMDWSSSANVKWANAGASVKTAGGGGGGDTNARLIGGDLLQPLGFGRLVC
jgi:hypothetical protein